MNNKQARDWHQMLDRLAKGETLSPQNVESLRELLPELPKQKTLEELRHEVYDAWIGSDGNEWPDDAYGVLEAWLYELHKQLRGLTLAEPAHPEFLETEADYRKAPEGTIVACEDSSPWHKFDSEWLSSAAYEGNSAKGMTGVIRRVLRWGK